MRTIYIPWTRSVNSLYVKRSKQRLTYVQFTSSVQGLWKNIYGHFPMVTLPRRSLQKTELIFTVNNENLLAYFSEENLPKVNIDTTAVWWNCSKLTIKWQNEVFSLIISAKFSSFRLFPFFALRKILIYQSTCRKGLFI